MISASPKELSASGLQGTSKQASCQNAFHLGKAFLPSRFCSSGLDGRDV